MLVADLLSLCERLAPASLAQEWDNSGLQVGDPAEEVRKVLASLELTEDVLEEAVGGGFDTIITHHPVLFSGIRSLLESRPKERLLRALVRNGISVVSCHTNLDAATGGIADLVAEALGLQGARPMECASTDWTKLVVFIPQDSVESVAEAVFLAGAGGVGRYSGCAFATEGTGWFTPGQDAKPAVGRVGDDERVAEVRWETVIPKGCVGAAVRALVDAHPYEEPAFDLYPVEDVLTSVGLGRVGQLSSETKIEHLAAKSAELFEVDGVRYCDVSGRAVRRVAVLPGSGRGSASAAVGQCDVLISGDFTYHDSELAENGSLGLIDVPHGGLEWWAFKRWCAALTEKLSQEAVELTVSDSWRDPWRWVKH